MKTTFEEFTQNTPKYHKDYFLSSMPKSIEFSQLWSPAVNKATKNGKTSATWASVMAIYNNLIKKLPKEEPVPKYNPKYDYYKKRFDLVPWTSQKNKEFYKSLLNQLKEKGKLSTKQWDYLKNRFPSKTQSNEPS
jgi:hypothetical protein